MSLSAGHFATRGAPILSVAQMRGAEQALFDAGVEPFALMQRAGEAAAAFIWRVGGMHETLVLCGPGNNGGDGFIIADSLRALGVPVRVAALGESGTQSSLRARAKWGGAVEDVWQASPAPQIVDALFGIGLTRGLEPALADKLTGLVNAAQHSFAIDVPSGIESDGGKALSPVPTFTHCIALGAWKPAHLLAPSRNVADLYFLANIGIEAPANCVTLMPTPRLRAPPSDAHKYSRGLVCVVAGTMPGAAALAAEAAARSGAGYVRLIGAKAQAGMSHVIVSSMALDFEKAKAVLIGPGLGRDGAAWERVQAALGADVPVVADADALCNLAQRDFEALPKPAIITPHEGEFAALFGHGTGNKIDRTRAAAAQSDSIVVHKGPDTVVAAPDGRCVVAPPASSWLSTAGTGDVLAGLCAGRLAVTGDPFRAACEAIWLHGEAARRSGTAFTADDLVGRISQSFGSAL